MVPARAAACSPSFAPATVSGPAPNIAQTTSAVSHVDVLIRFSLQASPVSALKQSSAGPPEQPARLVDHVRIGLEFAFQG